MRYLFIRWKKYSKEPLNRVVRLVAGHKWRKMTRSDKEVYAAQSGEMDRERNAQGRFERKRKPPAEVAEKVSEFDHTSEGKGKQEVQVL